MNLRKFLYNLIDVQSGRQEIRRLKKALHETGIERGYQEGYQEGFWKGYNEGLHAQVSLPETGPIRRLETEPRIERVNMASMHPGQLLFDYLAKQKREIGPRTTQHRAMRG